MKMFAQQLTSIALVSLLSFPALASPKSDAASYGRKYEGGSPNLKTHAKVGITMTRDQFICTQGKDTLAVPIKSITEVSYGNDVHRRVGAAIGLATVSLGIGALMLLAKTKKHYVGITWADSGSVGKGGMVFKVGKGEYRGFLAALEGSTGLKAVNADSVGSGGTAKP